MLETFVWSIVLSIRYNLPDFKNDVTILEEDLHKVYDIKYLSFFVDQ